MGEPRPWWRRRPRYRLGLRVAATAAILGLCVHAARRLDIATAAAMLRGAEPGWVLLATLVNFGY
jgi:uncharacterized membrane protein YbhN (UPF0104 family)